MSRAAKGADCKSAGFAFVGSSPTSPTIALRGQGLNAEMRLRFEESTSSRAGVAQW